MYIFLIKFSSLEFSLHPHTAIMKLDAYNAIEPKPENPKTLAPNTQINHVTKFLDERVKISFDRASFSSRFFYTSSSESIDLGRLSQNPSIINLPYKSHIDQRPYLPIVINLPYT